ncbi:hypothetical protein C8F04DRAFT_1188413 [Mycena alexandri]|nr:hypothetical protein C8F04DRAFT_1188413 [Mycena alexandri]
MGLLSQQAVPTRFPAKAMASFETGFSSADDVDGDMPAAAMSLSDAVHGQVAAFLNSARVLDGQIAKDATSVGGHHLYCMFSAIADAGLPSFRPNVFGNPESAYNLVHEGVFVDSFRAVASSSAYSSLYVVSLPSINDENLLRRVYRSFVYGFLRTQARSTLFSIYPRLIILSDAEGLPSTRLRTKQPSLR